MRRRNGRPGLIGTMARTAVIAGTATAVSGNMQQAAAQKQQAAAHEAAQKEAQAAQLAAMQEQVAALQSQQAPPAPVVAPPAAGGAGDLMTQLQQLASMHQAGILTDAEFAAAKARLLS
ncbi:MAG TPA: SHOCT domain-containing protein [Propionicimonas sp.]|nr:SHOCT domain-containing protein [Propionicimonas sp.]